MKVETAPRNPRPPRLSPPQADDPPAMLGTRGQGGGPGATGSCHILFFFSGLFDELFGDSLGHLFVERKLHGKLGLTLG